MYFSTHDIYAGHAVKFMALSLIATVLLFTAFPLISSFAPAKKLTTMRQIETVKLKKRTVRQHQKQNLPERPATPKPELADKLVFSTPRPKIPQTTGINFEHTTENFNPAFNVKTSIQDPNRIFDFTQVDIIPEPTKKVLPAYPLKARILGIEGTVELIFVVRPDGKVEQVKIEKATPEGMFERVALAAVKKWKYTPAQKDGVRVSSRVKLPLKFTLSNKDKEPEQQ